MPETTCSPTVIAGCTLGDLQHYYGVLGIPQTLEPKQNGDLETLL